MARSLTHRHQVLFITFAFGIGWLSPRQAGTVYVMSSLLAAVCLTIILNRRQLNEVSPDNPIDARARDCIKRKVRHHTFIIIVLLLILLYGL